ncbi:Arc family DNA-binding protein [Ensifer sp. MPMI2T]|nr:Arc family DNA-binding protein [Ensifer sp. MPMI2T]
MGIEMSENDEVRITLRLPERLRDRLRSGTRQSGRSMNNEIVDRLEQSFRSWPRVSVPAELFERVRRAPHYQRAEIEQDISKAAAQVIERALPTSGALHRDLMTLFYQLLKKAPGDKQEQLKERFSQLFDDLFNETDDRRKEPEI